MAPPSPPSSVSSFSSSYPVLTPSSPSHHNTSLTDRSPTERSKARLFHQQYQERRRAKAGEKMMEMRRERGREREVTDLYSPEQIEQFEQQFGVKEREEEERWAGSDIESTTTDSSSSGGLGINFYDHMGVGRRSVVFERVNTRDLEEVFGKESEERRLEYEEWDEGDDEEIGDEAVEDLHQQGKLGGKTNHKNTYAEQLNGNGRTLRATYQQQEQPNQQTPSISSLHSNTPRPHQPSPAPLKSPEIDFAVLTPKLLAPIDDPDWNHDSPLDLIDKYLEHNYREQAESFVRIASRETPVRALSGTRRAVSSNSAGSGSQPSSRTRSDRKSSRRSFLGISEDAGDDDVVGGDIDVGFGDALGLGLGIATVDKTAEVPEVDLPSQSPRPGGAGAVPSNTKSNDHETSPSPSLALVVYDSQKSEKKENESPSEHLLTNLQLRKGQQPALTRSTSSSSSLSIPVQPASKIQRASNLRQQRTGSGFSPSISLPTRSPSSPSTLSTSPFAVRHPGSTVRIPLHITSNPTIVKRPSRSSSTTTPTTSKSKSRPSSQVTRGPEYFTEEERLHITRLVHATSRNCEKHTNCTSCIDLEFAYYENKFLPRSMDPEQRQKIINNNRSLRNIKNELESLAEHGAISDEVYDTIMAALPAESSLGGSARSNPTPVQAQAPAPAPAPVNAFNNMRLNDPPPPAYSTPAAPSLPNRAPSAPPAKPEIARATALYRYAEPDDCTFEAGDQIAVHEYMNNDWWLGRNLRTGKEGVFPVNYVQVIPSQPQGPPAMHDAYGNEKSNYNNGYPGQYQQQQGPPPPGPSNPYNSSVPPMAVAEEPSKPGKGQEMGKKFGKKLGNAAIFGAGATIGGNIVNSIF